MRPPVRSVRIMERDRGPRGSAVDLGFGALSTPQLRALMRDETWLERIVKLSRKVIRERQDRVPGEGGG